MASPWVDKAWGRSRQPEKGQELKGPWTQGGSSSHQEPGRNAAPDAKAPSCLASGSPGAWGQEGLLESPRPGSPGTRSFQPLLDKSPVTFSQYVPTDPPTKREEALHTQPREAEENHHHCELRAKFTDFTRLPVPTRE